MECEFCQNHEQGDTLYEASDWDGGIGFDYIRDIKYCPLCGRMLSEIMFTRYEPKYELTGDNSSLFDKGINVPSKDELNNCPYYPCAVWDEMAFTRDRSE